jgi:hypothetical protein
MRSLLILSATIIFLSSCNSTSSKQQENNQNINKLLVADTIQYSVDIKAIDDDRPWIAEQLRTLDASKLVDNLFESVYRHQAEAYRFADNQPLTVEEVKEMEISDGFDRELAARLHFWERWKYDELGVVFEKEVLRVMIAYESRNDDGEFKGYKAGIVIEMKKAVK